MIFGEDAFWQTVVVPLIVAVGGVTTVIVAVADCTFEHSVEDETLTNAYTKVPAILVGALTVTLFPEVVVTNRSEPPLIL